MSGETRGRAEEVGGEAGYWLGEIERASRHEHDWREDKAPKVVERYRDDKRETGVRVNILWSNTETLKAAVLPAMPKPDVRRRFGDRDPVARAAAVVLERSLSYCADAYDAWTPLSMACDDLLLPGRGVVRVEYEAKTARVGEGEAAYERIADQKVRFAYVHWQDYRQQPARCDSEVTWRAFRHLLTRDELLRQFPDHADSVPLGWSIRADERDDEEKEERHRRSVVWEVWDKEKRQRLYVAAGYEHVLAQDDDPLRLEGFWPMPAPLTSVITTSSTIPVPLYTLYQDQAKELDKVTQRIERLVEALKRRGVRDGEEKALAHLASADDNQFIPVDRWAAFLEKGGLAGAFQTEDLTPIVQALAQLYQQRAMLVQTIYEVTGLSDIVRGASDPRETATAQKLKGQFGGLRLRKTQDQVQRFVRDLFRIKAEIIAEHFEPEQLAAISGIQLPLEPQMVPGPNGQAMPDGKPSWASVIQVLRSDHLRGYKVDIETDATVFEDAEQEKQARVEFLNAMTGFAEKWFQMAAGSPPLVKLAGEMMMFGARGFKTGRQLEETLEETIQALAQQAQQPQPDPEAMQAEKELQLKAQESQATLQLKQQEQQFQMQLNQQKQAHEQKMREIELAADLKLQEAKLASEQELARQKIATDGEVKREQARASAKPAVALDMGEKSGALADQLASIAERDSGTLQRAAEAQMQAAALQAKAAEAIAQATGQLAEAARMMAAPKRVVRDKATNQIIGSEPVLN